MSKTKGSLVRAVSTTEGLVVIFNKHSLRAIKDGQTVEMDLVTGNSKMHVMFMRDNTYRAKAHELQRLAKEAEDRNKGIADLAKDL